MALLVKALHLYGWYAVAVISAGLLLVAATWLAHAVKRWWNQH